MPFASRAGLRIHYTDEGDPAGPPVVMQHGITLTLDCTYGDFVSVHPPAG